MRGRKAAQRHVLLPADNACLRAPHLPETAIDNVATLFVEDAQRVGGTQFQMVEEEELKLKT